MTNEDFAVGLLIILLFLFVIGSGNRHRLRRHYDYNSWSRNNNDNIVYDHRRRKNQNDLKTTSTIGNQNQLNVSQNLGNLNNQSGTDAQLTNQNDELAVEEQDFVIEEKQESPTSPTVLLSGAPPTLALGAPSVLKPNISASTTLGNGIIEITRTNGDWHPGDVLSVQSTDPSQMPSGGWIAATDPQRYRTSFPINIWTLVSNTIISINLTTALSKISATPFPSLAGSYTYTIYAIVFDPITHQGAYTNELRVTVTLA